jgi:osmotically-inducible protein OsmY
MRALTSTLMVATLSAGLTACGGATWMDVGVGTGGSGVAVGTSVTSTTGASAGAATTESVVTENQLRAEWTSQALGDRTRVTGYVYNGWVMLGARHHTAREQFRRSRAGGPDDTDKAVAPSRTRLELVL